ncbi:MAG: hypothetical protein ABGZ17_29595, partial [Planctomycetaceae bacterium]
RFSVNKQSLSEGPAVKYNREYRFVEPRPGGVTDSSQTSATKTSAQPADAPESSSAKASATDSDSTESTSSKTSTKTSEVKESSAARVSQERVTDRSG